MKRVIHVAVLLVVITGLVFTAAGCKKASPDDAETSAIARQFFDAVFNTHDADLAMSLVGPIQTYGYVTREIVESTINDYVTKKCRTVADSESVGKPGADVVIPEITDTDAAKGITDRTAWLVASKYRCGAQNYDADHMTLVFLQKINGKWGVSQCQMYYGVNYWD
ncbi:MAG: hypothetical protein ACYCZF_07160 [Anaerolineae bacterium]